MKNNHSESRCNTFPIIHPFFQCELSKLVIYMQSYDVHIVQIQCVTKNNQTNHAIEDNRTLHHSYTFCAVLGPLRKSHTPMIATRRTPKTMRI